MSEAGDTPLGTPLTFGALGPGSASKAVGASVAMCSPTVVDKSCRSSAVEDTSVHSTIRVATTPGDIAGACSPTLVGSATPTIAQEADDTCPTTLVTNRDFVDTVFTASPLYAELPPACADSMLSEVRIARPVVQIFRFMTTEQPSTFTCLFV